MLGLPLAKVRVFAPDPGGGFGGKQHAKYEPLLAFMALRAGRPVRLVLTLEETFQAVRRGASEIRVRTGFRRDGTLVFRDIEANYLIGAYADIADRTVAKGSYTSGGPYRDAGGADRRAERPLAHRALDRVPRLRQPAADLGGRVEHGRGGAARSASTRSSCGCGTSPGRGDPFIPGDTPADGDWAETRRAGRRADRLGDARCRRAAAAGIAVGLKSGPTTGLSYSTVRLLADGSVVVYAGTSDMGQGARTIFAQIAAHELGAPLDWVTVVMGDTAVVPVRPADVGEPVVRADGQRRAQRAAATIQAQAAGDGRAARGGRRGRRSSSTRGEVRIGDRALPIRDVLDRAGSAGSAARSSASARCARRPSPTIRSAARPRSSSSTARPSRSRSTGRPATSRSTGT